MTTAQRRRGRLGRLPATPARPRLRVAPFLAAPPAPPDVADWYSAVTSWPVYGNDRYGCCIIEGTMVRADAVRRAYRVRYDGPALRLEFASGHVLTVTPNHAVLTPRGFVRARLLQQGDYAVRARRPQMLEGGQHFNQTPAPAEKIFAALSRRGSVTRQRTQSRFTTGPDDFHGDARFFDGDVDVVGAFSLLESQRDASLREPYGKREILTAGQLKSGLHGFRAAFQPAPARWAAPQSGVGSLGDLRSLSDGHAGVAHAEGSARWPYRVAGFSEQPAEPAPAHAGFAGQFDPAFPGVVALKERPQGRAEVAVSADMRAPDTLKARRKLVASVLHPSFDGAPTDAELAADLIEGFPGLVESDRLVDIHRQRYHGYVYDLSTDRRWYVANEIVVHNCVFAEIGHQVGSASAYTASEVLFTDTEILAEYSRVTGFSPADPATDQGAVIQDALTDWRKNGIGDMAHKCLAFAEADVANRAEIMQCVAAFSSLDAGCVIYAGDMAAFDAGQPWDTSYAKGALEGGHSVEIVGYDQQGGWLITWGHMQRFTWGWWVSRVEEAWLVILPEWLDAQGRSPSGFDLHGLGQRMADLTGDPNPFPQPAPPPAPVPDAAADQILAGDPRILAWMAARHTGSNAYAAQRVRAWKQAKGL